MTISCKHFTQDSTSFISKVGQLLPHGNITAGYEYGYLPFLIQDNPPVGNFKTDGNFQIQVKSLPFQASFYYSSLGTISGLNNHFTIRFDAQKYREQLLEKVKLNDLNRIATIDSLGKVKQKLKTKLDYLYLVKDRKVTLPIDSSKFNFPSVPNFNNQLDSLHIGILDSLNPNIPNTPELPEFDLGNYMDSIGNEINSLTEQVQMVNNKIDQFKHLNSLSQDSLVELEMNKVESPWMKKINGIMSHVQRFDIGLTYPNYSQFLIARIPIRGVNFEFQKKKLFFAFTHGKTVNNIFFTNNIIQNNLNAARNLYNFFDFNNVSDGRRVTALKVGVGQKKGTHIHLGLLYGLGKVSYQDTSLIVDNEQNLVLELDGGLKIKKSHFLTVSYGRSAIQTNHVNFGDEGSLFDGLVNLNERTNALLGRYELDLKSIQLSASVRWIDPYYRSFGVGFLRSDNIRYELKYKQKIGKKVGLDLYLRRENDNLLGLYNYQNVLLSYGVGTSYRPTKHWMLKADIRPITLQANNQIDSLAFENNNFILNGVVNYNNRINNTYINATCIYSYYKLSLDESSQVYRNLNANITIENKTLSNVFIFNQYQTTDTTSVPLASLIQNNFTYKMKKLYITGTLKGSFSQNEQFDFGYGVQSQLKLNKLISVQIGFDKLVIGDFYNSIYGEEFLDFPYRFTSSIALKW